MAIQFNKSFSTNYSNNLLIKPLITFHHRVITTFDDLPETGKVQEIAKRVAIIISVPFSYLSLSLLSLVGLALNSWIMKNSSKQTEKTPLSSPTPKSNQDTAKKPSSVQKKPSNHKLLPESPFKNDSKKVQYPTAEGLTTYLEMLVSSDIIITTLDISGSKIIEAQSSITKICEFIENYQPLKTLKINEFDITITGMKELLVSLTKNYTLHTIEIQQKTVVLSLEVIQLVFTEHCTLTKSQIVDDLYSSASKMSPKSQIVEVHYADRKTQQTNKLKIVF